MPMVVIMGGLPGRTSPQEVFAEEHGAVGACEFIDPVLSRKGLPVALGVALQADAAGLAGSHAAGHRPLDGDLALDVTMGGDVGDTFHHRLGTAGVEDWPEFLRE